MLEDIFERASDDRVFFLASGLTFSLVLAALPLLLLLLFLPTLILGGELDRFQEEALSWFWRVLPVATPELQVEIRQQVRSIVEAAGQIGLVSAVLFAWFGTRLFGALRSALSEVFDIEETRSVLRGKVTDFQLVVVTTTLLAVNIGISAVLGDWGRRLLEELGFELGVVQAGLALLTVFLTVFLAFLLIYRYVPARRLEWRTAGVAALFAAISFELLKYGFTWYVTNWADYTNVFFAFATVVVVVIGLYYGSVLFLLGGEVAKAYERRRLARKQHEILY